MKKLLLWLAVVVVCVLVALWIGNSVMNRRVADQAWPAGLGTLDEVEARFPRQDPSAAARRLTELALPLGIDFAAKKSSPNDLQAELSAYVQAQHGRATPTIEEPPARVTAHIAKNAAQIDSLGNHLSRGGELHWTVDMARGFDAPIPNLLAHMNTARLLSARALIRGRASDARAWEDLHAVSALGRSLESRPELISQLIALAIARMGNAIAWKMPVPAPGWWSEREAVDHRRLILGAMQAETWMMWRRADSAKNGFLQRVASPYLQLSMANYAVHQRETAAAIAAVTACGFDGAAFDAQRLVAIPRWNVMARVATPNLASTWTRALRFDLEREATSNALRIRTGAPLVERSQCSDGTWTFAERKLSFTRDLPSASATLTVMPLTLQIPLEEVR